MHVKLDQPLEEFVSGLVASGEYASEDAVIREGLMLLRDRLAGRGPALEELRRQIQIGLDDIARDDIEELDMATIRAEARREWEEAQARNAR